MGVVKMKARRVLADAFFQPPCSPIPPFLNPSLYLQTRHRLSVQSSRTFSSNTSRPQQESESSSDDIAPKTAPPNPPKDRSSPTHQIQDLLSGLQSSPERQASRNKSNPLFDPRGNSGTDLLHFFRESNKRGSPSTRDAISRMETPRSGMGPLAPPRAAPAPPPIRLSPALGRSVAMEGERGRDLGRALTLLNIRCAQEVIKGDSMQQRFHERPGKKRKRIKSATWRKSFLKGFRDVVYKVQDMKRKGW
ncbi:MAG: hypothetical protein M1833_003998 [Piccolia ochrophora]|nr:MAG: hypothetical protein M1833_003998 [Piccolia ochrophora]